MPVFQQARWLRNPFNISIAELFRPR